MNIRERFIKNIFQQININGVTNIISLLTSPPGRKPREELKLLSSYFNSKTQEEKQLLENIIKLAVNATIFDILCVLDQVNKVSEDIEELKLVAIKNKKEILLNDINEPYLHDLFNVEIGNFN